MRPCVPLSAVPRLLVALATGAVAGMILGLLVDARLGLLTGISVTELAFVVVGWLALWPMDAMRHPAQRPP